MTNLAIFRRHLIHQCTVQRASIAQNSIGEPIDTWSNSSTIDCRFVAKSEQIASESVGFQMIETYLLLVNPSADVQENDRVVNIVLKEDSSVVDTGPFTIESTLDRNATKPSPKHHISLQLERVE